MNQILLYIFHEYYLLAWYTEKKVIAEIELRLNRSHHEGKCSERDPKCKLLYDILFLSYCQLIFKTLHIEINTYCTKMLTGR